MLKSYALYIHIPFCIKKCFYCDFCSFDSELKSQDEYIDYLIKEIKLITRSYGSLNIKTIFIGGGTPSILSIENITRLSDSLRENFVIENEIEFSIEANPGTLTKEKLEAYKTCGINRISIGLQTTQNNILKELGRIHTYEEFLASYKLVREAGYTNVNIDLMYGLPNQSEREWLETLERVVSLSPEHISAYSLKIEDNTPFAAMERSGEILLPSEVIDRKNHHKAINFLESNGYKQYEISNFSKENYECKHNLVYWQNQEYIGLGLSSHGFKENIRYGNTCDIEQYKNLLDEDKLPLLTIEEIGEQDSIFETLMLGLRLNKGVSFKEFKGRYNISIDEILGEELEKMILDGVIVKTSESIVFTELGMDISNTVLVKIMIQIEKFFKQY